MNRSTPRKPDLRPGKPKPRFLRLTDGMRADMARHAALMFLPHLADPRSKAPYHSATHLSITSIRKSHTSMSLSTACEYVRAASPFVVIVIGHSLRFSAAA